MNYGRRIATLRDKNKWTQEELAKKLGISRAALSHYEKGRREPDFATLTKLADVFSVSVDFLIGRTNAPNSVLEQNIRDFADQLELSDEEILQKFTFTIDGKELSKEEAKRFIAFVRAERMMNL
ncbi:MAG TPA: helix-turn-helix transcriptional regulator [Bacilli bacterium]